VNSLFGKPDWFYGVMLNREEKLNVVDAAKWVMPEKYSDDMEAGLNYKYVIMLGESQWGLTAELLVETELIQPDAVKWRKGPGK
jgi:purine-binding chemotaxis protein CheW